MTGYLGHPPPDWGRLGEPIGEICGVIEPGMVTEKIWGPKYVDHCRERTYRALRNTIRLRREWPECCGEKLTLSVRLGDELFSSVFQGKFRCSVHGKEGLVRGSGIVSAGQRLLAPDGVEWTVVRRLLCGTDGEKYMLRGDSGLFWVDAKDLKNYVER